MKRGRKRRCTVRRPAASARSKRTRKLWRNPTYRAKQAAATRKLWRDPAFRAAAAERMRKLWRDPAFRMAQKAGVRMRLRKLWRDPAARAAAAERMRKRWCDPLFRAERSCLTSSQIDMILTDIDSGRPYIDIAIDWLITASTVSQIAIRHGRRRRLYLSEADQSVLCRRIASGELYTTLSVEFGVHRTSLHRIAKKFGIQRPIRQKKIRPPKAKTRFNPLRLYRLLEDAKLGIKPAHHVRI